MSGDLQGTENSRILRPASRAFHVSRVLAMENPLPSIKRLVAGKPELFAFDQVQLEETNLLESKASELKAQHWSTVTRIIPAISTLS